MQDSSENNSLGKEKAPLSAKPSFRYGNNDRLNQRPKNNHNKMITGIGTPKSQSKIPRPIIASLKSRLIQERLRECEVPVKVMGKRNRTKDL
jgi:hypothetical protein